MQEVQSHKRVIDVVTEKAQVVSQQGDADSVLSMIKSVCERYENLVDKLQKSIRQLEDSLNAYQVFQDLQKAHQDYQKQLWEKLSVFTGVDQFFHFFLGSL